MKCNTVSVSLLLLSVIFSVIGCRTNNSYYIVGNNEQQQELQQLFTILENKSKFIVIQRIIKLLHNSGYKKKLNLFLTTYIQKNQEDPFNAYYLLIVAQNYMEEKAYPFAVHYFERILNNYSDLSVRGKSVHYICLKNLVQLVDTPEVKVNYYRDLLGRFPEEIDKGSTYYRLATTYEKLGEWDLAIQAYKNFLKFPETHITGIPEAQQEAQSMVDFYLYDGEDWTMESLDDLVNTIKWAIYRRDVRTLRRYMSEINFFTTSWEEQVKKSEEDFEEHLGTFLNSRIRYMADLDRDSNAQEAYLKTTGWSYRIKTWYLYFRKVHFPADPERHGRWEWAGIYFGEKPFAGDNEAL